MTFQIKKRPDEWRLIADRTCLATVIKNGETFEAFDFENYPIGEPQPTQILAMDLARNRFNHV